MAKKTKTAKEEPKAPEQPLVLGVAVRGELKDIPLIEIDDPSGPPDRLARSDDAEQIAELARSIREVGQVQPVMVEQADGAQGGRYVRVFGRRRIAAAKLAGLDKVRAIVVPPLEPEQRRTIVAVENIQRKNLTPIEEQLGVWALCEMQTLRVAADLRISCPRGEYLGHVMHPNIIEGMTRRAKAEVIEALLSEPTVRTKVCDTVAAMLAKTPTWVRDRMYIGRLGDDGHELILSGRLPLTHAREIAKLGLMDDREKLAKDYAAGGACSISDTEPGPLEDLRDSVGRRVFSLRVVPWKLDVPFAGTSACEGCEHNSATQPGLFEHGGVVSESMRAGEGDCSIEKGDSAVVQKAGVCTHHACYASKLREAKSALGAAAKRVEEKKDPTDAQLEILKPAAIKDRVEERKYLRKARPKSTRDLGPSPETAERRRRDDTESKLAQALMARVKDTEKLVLAKLAKTPGQWAMVQMLMQTKDFEHTHHYDKKKACKAAAAPGMKSLLMLLADPSWENLLKIEQQCGRRFGLFAEWKDGPSGMADAIAAAVGVELDAPPTIEDFLEQSDAPKPAKPAKKRAAKSEDDDAGDGDEE